MARSMMTPELDVDWVLVETISLTFATVPLSLLTYPSTSKFLMSATLRTSLLPNICSVTRETPSERGYSLKFLSKRLESGLRSNIL